MAGQTVFAPRYANAFASVAASTGMDVAAAQAQMNDFAETLDSSKDLREVLMNPSIPADQKLGVLDGLSERLGMFREVRNFIAVIVDHERLNALREILDEYHLVADAAQGLTDVAVISARDLNEDDRREVEAQVARLAASRVRVAYSINPSLLGGAVIKIGSKVYDGSLRMQLDQMKQALVTA